MTYKPVVISKVEDSVSIDMVARMYKGKQYAAGMCFVTALGAEIRAIACKAGRKKEIVLPGHAVAWLTKNGCHNSTARALVKRAQKARAQ